MAHLDKHRTVESKSVESKSVESKSVGRKTVSIDGHRLTLTNLEKVLYPATGTTKGEVLAYYAEIAPFLIHHAANRPATRKRWVNGVGSADSPGDSFFQKNLDSATPPWVQRHALQHKERVTEYPLVNDLATLTWLAQSAALELHVPQWRVGPEGDAHNPDRMILDLDPGPGAGLAECVVVAGFARDILSEMSLITTPVTSGSKGIHLYSALDGRQTSAQVSAVAHELARALEADHPDLVVSNMSKSLRVGKVLVDWSQNNGSNTTVTPYSLRGRAEPTVAAPRTWDELLSGTVTQLDFREVLRRVTEFGDPMSAVNVGAGAEDRLVEYRRKRDSSKTPEPVPPSVGTSCEGASFVIQEHHARALHWDFRLEHHGVLVSWALPKGMPMEKKRNHLAVQTEDHPLEYGSFAGNIPKGEYGAGQVAIWDAGTYELEKWRDGKEVIVTLRGGSGGGLGGRARFALIHTGTSDGQSNNWLIHRMSTEGNATPQTPTAKKSAQKVRYEPMLASSDRSIIDDDDEWSYEIKWDGIRVIARVTNDRVQLASRNGLDLTARFPELTGLVDAVNGVDCVIDGELVAIGPGGRPDFGLIQQRLGLSRPGDIERMRVQVPVQFMVFDILEAEGISLVDEPYSKRRAVLEESVIAGKSSVVQVPPLLVGSVSDAIATSRELDLEGVIAKKRDGQYFTGRRSSSWVKLKNQLTQEVVIGGWRSGRGARAGGVGSLLVGIPEGNTIRYVGRVGTGFTDKMLAALEGEFVKRRRKISALSGVPPADVVDAHWISADLVGEVEFAGWTRGGRLRHPVWKGLRIDKNPSEVQRE